MKTNFKEPITEESATKLLKYLIDPEQRFEDQPRTLSKQEQEEILAEFLYQCQEIKMLKIQNESLMEFASNSLAMRPIFIERSEPL